MDDVVSLSEPARAGSLVPAERLARVLPVPMLLTAVAAVVTWWPCWGTDVALGLINVLVPVSFVAIGIVLLHDRSQRVTGLLMLVAAPCYIMTWWWSWPPEWQIGPLPLASFVLGYGWFVCGGFALVRYPDRGRGYERTYFGVMTAWILALKSAIAVTSRPEWNGYAAHAWWPALLPDRAPSDLLRSVFDAGIAAIAVLLLAVLLLKLRRSRGLERLDTVPVIVAACAVALCGGAYLIGRWAEIPVALMDALRAATGVAALVTPLAFLATVLRRGLARSSVADLVLRLAEAPSVDGVQRAIRGTLQDPLLRVLFWLPAVDGYVDAEGARWAGDAGGRWSVPVQSRSGMPLAVLLLDPTLRRYPALVRSVVVAGGFALENGRLHADVAAQLAEVRASRARIVEETMAERRRLERDLHDGAQQSLLAVTTSLSTARMRAGRDVEVVQALEQARVDLGQARRELRDLARGIHPAVLSQSGLHPAIEGIAERLGLPVVLDLPDQRLPTAMESTCYFVVAEALTNVVKHSAATHVAVGLRLDADDLLLTVADDGCGGASASAGSGIAGLADRVRALGGDLVVDSPSGAGTTVSVRMPCG